MPKLARTARRNAPILDAAIAFARDRIAAQVPGVKPRRRRPGAKALLLGGAAGAAGAAALLKRDKVAALLPRRRDEPAPPPPAHTPPPVSDYGASGPVANTATVVPDLGETAAPEELPPAEAGESESEGSEQAQAEAPDDSDRRTSSERSVDP